MLAWCSDGPGHVATHYLSLPGKYLASSDQDHVGISLAIQVCKHWCPMKLVEMLASEIFVHIQQVSIQWNWKTYFLANMEVSKQNVKTDWEWEESSNRSNDLTTFNIRCHFISHNLNMPTNCLASKVVTILLLLPHTIIQLLELFMFLLL